MTSKKQHAAELKNMKYFSWCDLSTSLLKQHTCNKNKHCLSEQEKKKKGNELFNTCHAKFHSFPEAHLEFTLNALFN